MSGIVGCTGARSGVIGSATFSNLNINSLHLTTNDVSFSGWETNWSNYNLISGTAEEDGIRIYQMGKLYILQISVQYAQPSAGGEVNDETIYTFSSSEIDLPGGTVFLGNALSHSLDLSSKNATAQLRLETGGDLAAYGYNITNPFIICANYMGLDTS